MNRQRGSLRWRRALTTGATLAVGLVAAVVPAGTAHAAVAVDEPALRNVLFSALTRVQVESPRYDRYLVLSAELTGWRASHATADSAAILAHLDAVAQSIDVHLDPVDARRPGHEMVSRLIEIVQRTDGAAVAGPGLTDILASLVRRDRIPGLVSVEHRVGGAQQLVNWETDYLDAQHAVWSGVSDLGSTDADFRTAWNASIGVRAGVDAGSTLDALTSTPRLAGLVDVDALLALRSDPTAYRAEVERQFQIRRDEHEQNLAALTAQAASASQPSSSPAPGGAVTQKPQDIVDQAEKDRKERQKYIDGAKSVLDALATLAGFLDPGLGKKISAFAKTAYTVATGINKLITGIKLLGQVAKSFSLTGAFGVVGLLSGGLMDVLTLFGLGSPPDGVNQAIRQDLSQIKQILADLGAQMHERFDRIEAALNELYGEMMAQFANVLALLGGQGQLLAQIQEALMRLETKVQALGEQILQAQATVALDPFLEHPIPRRLCPCAI